jgi:hypothetical protein
MLLWMPSMCVGLTGVLVTGILLAADWYIWDSRYWISQQCAPELAPSKVADGTGSNRVSSASGRELVTTLPAPSPQPNALSLHQLQGGWMDHCS